MVRQQLTWETKANFSAQVYTLILFLIPFPHQPTVKQKKGLQYLMLKESSKAFKKNRRGFAHRNIFRIGEWLQRKYFIVKNSIHKDIRLGKMA